MNDPTEDIGFKIVPGLEHPVYDPSLKPKCHPIPEIPKDIIARGGMDIGPFKVQPILLYIPDADYWVERWKSAQKHFAENGLINIIEVPGIHGKLWGIAGTHTYDKDNPGEGFKIGPGYAAQFLSVYMLYNIAAILPFDWYLFLECDARLKPDFLHHLSRELYNVPSDADWIYVGHCCVEGKTTKHIKGNVYKFDTSTGYPFAGHCFLVNRKVIPYTIGTQRDTYASSDLSLCYHTFPQLNIYAIVPRLADQFNTDLAL